MNKKAQAAYVAYVLLIGLSVTLAVIVGRWSIEQAQKSSENVLKRSLIEDKCEQIAISGFLDCTKNKINITNRGNLIIDGIKAVGEGSEGCLTKEKKEKINPGKSILIDRPSQDLNKCNTAVILPLTSISEEEIGCTEKRVVLNLAC
ncbi:hypothetical protein HYX16_01575 [Candidatus Woesearchaeota archaeon]|nr:hypothetical protein [Candidatus Woesearchaeota archaeon]